MAKEVTTVIKLQVPAGGANPSPPVGPALGQHGLNIMDFCNAFNDKTKEMEKGLKVPVEITVFENSDLLEPPYGDKYLGFVFSQANEKASVLNALKNAMNTSMPIIK